MSIKLFTKDVKDTMRKKAPSASKIKEFYEAFFEYVLEEPFHSSIVIRNFGTFSGDCETGKVKFKASPFLEKALVTKVTDYRFQNNYELNARIANSIGLSEDQVRTLMIVLITSIYHEALSGKSFIVRGVMTFRPVDLKGRSGVLKGKKWTSPPKKTIRIKLR